MASKPSRRYRPLTRRSDFLHLKNQGRSFHVTGWLLANVEATELGVVRCGWTLPRQTGPAVLRNRFKRWGREFMRKWANSTDISLDLNLVFKRRDKDFYKSLSHEEFDGALEKLVAKLHSLGK